ncbi:sulfotransferase family protein [Hahella ganghwensis]|uniref:sulfotransferase family protein n=1 Tax=Hahella ganghwensis TaxID=286420 RepID=UPI0003A75F33|nr:sulfotransferase [Hahella ganghwensis]
MNSNLLLIGGSPRSGTTAILQILNSDPRVFISSEENLLKASQTLSQLLSTRERRTKALSKGMRELSPRETLSMDNIHSHNFNQDSLWPTLKSIYEHHHSLLHPETPLLLWGDKLPAYAKEINNVLQMPGARYLHITRNPLDVINSMLRRMNAAKQGRDWWKAITDFDDMLSAWVEAYTAVQDHQNNPNVFHLYYEDLVFDFDRTVSTLNDFLGIELEYINSLVSDPALHFDRSFITDSILDSMSGNAAVRSYAANYLAKTRSDVVRNSLRCLIARF